MKDHLVPLVASAEPKPELCPDNYTEAQQIQETLREKQANLDVVLENTRDAVWSVDRYYRILTLNSVFRTQFLLAYGVELEVGRIITDYLPVAERSLWIDSYDRALQGESFTLEQHFHIADTLVEVEFSFNPVIAGEDKITGVAVFGRDITDRKRARQALQEARDQLEAVLDAVPGCISWFSSDLRYRGINRYLASTFNLSPEIFIGQEIGFLESSPAFSNFVRQFFASPVKESSVELAANVDGVFRSYLIVAQKYNQDQAAVFVGIEITERRRMEEALRESQERFALAVRGANDGIWDWNLRTNEIYVSPRWKSMLGLTEESISNSPEEWFQRIHPEDVEQVKSQIKRHVDGLTHQFEDEHRMLHQDGSYRWMLSRGLVVRDNQGQATRMAGSQTDITERKRTEQQLLHDAFHDGLTDLPNRALFLDRLSQAIERSKRSKDFWFAVLFLDVDRFKVVNDSLGHMRGDQLLVKVAERLKHCLQSGDTVARLGGDEFTILLEDIKDLSEATRTAEEIHRVMQTPFDLEGQEVFINVSIGIALSTTGYERPEEPLRDADTAMYRAKALGRGRHEVFDQVMHDRVVARLQLETDLRRAIERGEFQLYYQPIVAVATERIVGFEALVRWQHPEKGLCYPSDFIPIAEETGLIIPLGDWVLREACVQLRQWQAQFPQSPPLIMSVNLSGRQFSQPNLVQQVADSLQATGLDPHCLKLEITESVVMENATQAISMLQELKSLGVQLQIDDFGTGYSSLSYLHQFPTDTLKIDRSFVSRLGVGEGGVEIVQAIITLAHNLGMNVTAEGVETPEQLHELKRLQSEHGQGYLFSKPVTSQAAMALLKAQQF